MSRVSIIPIELAPVVEYTLRFFVVKFLDDLGDFGSSLIATS
jgi:hypothetical protein